MKKIIVSLTILALFSTSVFALPASPVLADRSIPAASQPEALQAASFSPSVDDDLFATIDAVQLSDTEAAQVEGGFFDPASWLVIIVVTCIMAVGGLKGCDALAPVRAYP